MRNMSNFIDVGIKDYNSKIRRALIVKEAIEILKAQGNLINAGSNPFVDIDKSSKDSADMDKRSKNLVKLYADWIEEALKIKENA